MMNKWHIPGFNLYLSRIEEKQTNTKSTTESRDEKSKNSSEENAQKQKTDISQKEKGNAD